MASSYLSRTASSVSVLTCFCSADMAVAPLSSAARCAALSDMVCSAADCASTVIIMFASLSTCACASFFFFSSSSAPLVSPAFLRASARASAADARFSCISDALVSVAA
jgi:hypothetical protein